MSGDYALIEDRQTGKVFQVAKEMISSQAKEGDILKLEEGQYVVDMAKTKEQREYIQNLMNKLKKK